MRPTTWTSAEGGVAFGRRRTGRSSMLLSTGIGSAIVALVLAVTLPGSGHAAMVEATSWIDAPLNGAVLPLAPYGVVAHSADQAGVAEVVFTVGGTEQGKTAVAGGPRLATSRFSWNPPGQGTFLLVVRARSVRGEWGAPGVATVIVSSARPTAAASSGAVPGASPASAAPTESTGPSGSPAPGVTAGPTATAGPTGSPASGPPSTPGASATAIPTPTATPTRPPAPTPTPTSAPSPTPTPTPTPAPCLPPAPTLTLPPNGSTVSGTSNPPSFEWMYDPMPSCVPTTFRIRISLNRDLSSPLYDQIKLASDDGGGPIWTWTPPAALPFVDANCRIYYWAVTARASNGSAGGTSSTWWVQACR